MLDREDERRGVAGLRREALGEQVQRLLGLAAGRREVIGEITPERCAEAAEDGEEHEDDGERALPVPGGRGGEASEEMGHAFQRSTLAAKMQ